MLDAETAEEGHSGPDRRQDQARHDHPLRRRSQPECLAFGAEGGVVLFAWEEARVGKEDRMRMDERLGSWFLNPSSF